MSQWYLYLLDCDGRLYTGISTDPERRLREHAAGKSRGAKFTRAAQRIELRYSVAVGDRSLASRLEARMKRLDRAGKLAIIERHPDRQALLDKLGVE